MRTISVLFSLVISFWGLVSCGGRSGATLDDIDLIPLEDPDTREVSYYDLDGQVAIEKTFQSADFFSDGLAKVTLGEYGDFRRVFINRQGEEVIDLSSYRAVTGFWNGLAWALREDGVFVALSPDGDEAFTVPGKPISMFNSDQKALIQIDQQTWGIVNGRGRITPIWTEYHIASTCEIHADRLVVYGLDGAGVIDLEGNVIVPPGTYDEIELEPYDINGYAIGTRRHGNWVLIDRNGQKLIDKYWYITSCDGKDWYFFVDRGNEQRGWCDPHGTVRLSWPDLPIQYWQDFQGGEYAYFHLFMSQVKDNKTEAAIDRHGTVFFTDVWVQTPVLGKRVVLGRKEDHKVYLCSPDGSILNPKAFYEPWIMEGLAYGRPYVDMAWIDD